MAQMMIQSEDQDHDSSPNTYGSAEISCKKTNGQDTDLAEIITLDNKDMERKEETLPIVISIDYGFENGSRNAPLFNRLSVCGDKPMCIVDLSKTEDGRSGEDLLFEATCTVDCKPSAMQDFSQGDKRLNTGEKDLVNQPEDNDLPKAKECFTSREDVSKNATSSSSEGDLEATITFFNLPQNLNCSYLQEELDKNLESITFQKDINKNTIQSLGQEDTYLLVQVEGQDLTKTSNCSNDLRDPKEIIKGQEANEPQESSNLLNGEDHLEQECPICTELYDASSHKQSLLNCNHVFCDNCIKTIVTTANRANLGLVTCPICRQKTPMMEWEIRKMQDQMMDSGGIYIQQAYIPPEPVVRRPGLCGSLEYRFQKRFQTGRLFGFPPCIRNSHRLVHRLNRLERRCRCLYLCALVFLLFSEFFCVLFLFLPILTFILMIIFGK